MVNPETNKGRGFLIWWPCLAYVAFIYWLSAIPKNYFESVISISFPFFDKIVHLLLFGFLGMVLVRALRFEIFGLAHTGRLRYVFGTIILFLALLDEAHQFFVPGRSVEWGDLLADIVGAGMGGWLYTFILRRQNKDHTVDAVENDQRGFGFLVAMTYFVVLILLNLFDYKRGYFVKFPIFILATEFIEFGLLGFLTIRFLYLRRTFKKFILRDWLLFLLCGTLLLVAYQVSFLLLKNEFVRLRSLFLTLIFFMSGGGFYYISHQLEVFRERIVQQPQYYRKTWQRIYFFLPPLMLMTLGIYLSTHRSVLGHDWPEPAEIFPETGFFSFFRNFYVLHSLQYFIFGIFYFRAIFWELYWHLHKKVLWSLAFISMIVLAIGDEVVQSFTPERVADPYDALANLVGFGLAVLFYLFGYRGLRLWYKRWAPDAHKKCEEFEV